MMDDINNILHDNAIVSIGEYVGKLYGPEAYVKFAQTCKRLNRLLLPAETESSLSSQHPILKEIIRCRIDYVSDDHIIIY